MSYTFSKNGQFFPKGSGEIPPTDRGFLYGDAVFETIASFGKELINMESHLDRLERAVGELGFTTPIKREELRFELQTNLDALINSLPPMSDGLYKARNRLTMTRGSYTGLSTSLSQQANRYILTELCHNQKMDRCSLKSFKANSNLSFPISIKTPNYLESIYLKSRMSEGFTDVLWLDEDKYILEASVSNIFFLGRHGDIIEVATPKLRRGVLNGRMRQLIIDLLEFAQIKVTESDISLDEIPRFDEAFLTSSIQGVLPIDRIDNMAFHTRRKNCTFQHMERLLDIYLNKHTGKKISFKTGIYLDA